MTNDSLIKCALTLLVSVLLCTKVCAYDFETNGLCYTIASEADATVTLTGYADDFADIYKEGNVTIPENVTFDNKNYKVVSIGENAFYSCRNLISIEIPSTVTSIGEYAFNSCTSMSSIIIHKYVKPMDDAESIFQNCPITQLSTASPFLLNNTK